MSKKFDITRVRLCSKAFGQRLKYLRMIKDLSQEDLAWRLGGFQIDTISRIERGDAVGVPLDMIAALTQLACEEDVSCAWLFGGCEEPRMAERQQQTGNEINLNTLVQALHMMSTTHLAKRELEKDPGLARTPRIARLPSEKHLRRRIKGNENEDERPRK